MGVGVPRPLQSVAHEHARSVTHSHGTRPRRTDRRRDLDERVAPLHRLRSRTAHAEQLLGDDVTHARHRQLLAFAGLSRELGLHLDQLSPSPGCYLGRPLETSLMPGARDLDGRDKKRDKNLRRSGQLQQLQADRLQAKQQVEGIVGVVRHPSNPPAVSSNLTGWAGWVIAGLRWLGRGRGRTRTRLRWEPRIATARVSLMVVTPPVAHAQRSHLCVDAVPGLVGLAAGSMK